MTTLSGSRILIIGATGVLGTLLAHSLSDAGAKLALSGRDADRLAERAELGATIVADLNDVDAADAVVSEAVAALGGLDGVIVAAGVVGFDQAGGESLDQLEKLFAVNALAPIRVVQGALPALTDSGEEGREPFVLTLSGIVSEFPTAGIASYSASKSAIAAFMVASSRTLRRKKIRLIDARPGHIETGLADRALFGTAPEFASGLAPQDVVDRIVTALASDETELPSTAFGDDVTV